MTAQERAALVALVAKLDREIREPLEVAASYDVPEEATLGWRLHGRECRKALVALDGLKLAALSALPSGGAEGPTREQVEALRAEGVKLTVPVGYYNGYHSALDAVLALYAEPATEPTP
jgi:hypothetical protein